MTESSSTTENARLETIRKRHVLRPVEPCNHLDGTNCQPAAICEWCDDEWPCDVAVLLAKVERLREICAMWKREHAAIAQQRDTANAALAKKCPGPHLVPAKPDPSEEW